MAQAISKELELREMLRSAGRVLEICSHHQYSDTITKFHDLDETTETVWEFSEGALLAQKELKNIIEYLKNNVCAEEEEIKRKRFVQSLIYNI